MRLARPGGFPALQKPHTMSSNSFHTHAETAACFGPEPLKLRETTNSSGASVWRGRWLGNSVEFDPETERLLVIDSDSRCEVFEVDRDGDAFWVDGESVTDSATDVDWSDLERAIRQVPRPLPDGNPHGVILVQVPHVTRPKAYAFESREKLLQSLRDNDRRGFSYRVCDRADWLRDAPTEEEDERDFALWVKPGLDLFDAGAERIVEVWYNESNRQLFTKEEAPTELDARLEAIHDFHSQYLLDREGARAAVKSGVGHDHKRNETYGAIVDAARELEWIR